MPEYTFRCEECEHLFIRRMMMGEYTPRWECPQCGSDNVNRDYASDGINFIPPQHTLGSLADRNTTRMSDDQKKEMYAKHNDYKKGFDREIRSD